MKIGVITTEYLLKLNSDFTGIYICFLRLSNVLYRLVQ